MTAGPPGYPPSVERDEQRIEEAERDMASDVREMESRASELGEDVEDLKSEWRRKQDDPSVPGAEPTGEEEAGGEVAGDWQGEGPAATEAGQ